MKTKQSRKVDRLRLTAILIVSVFVILTGSLFAYKSFSNGNISGGILGVVIAIIILTFAIIVYKRGNKDLRDGYPIQDERSRRVLEKASSLAFYVSIYLLLGVGFLSDELIKFRDVSQATSITVGCMALLFLIFWIYYNKKEI